MHIEYAITNGKGILLDYGVVDCPRLEFRLMMGAFNKGYDMISQHCSQDCQTGK